MKAKELIAKLQEFDGELKVVTTDDRNDCFEIKNISYEEVYLDKYAVKIYGYNRLNP